MLSMYIPDNYDAFEAHDAEQQEKYDKLPECSHCLEKITDDYAYIIDEECVCEDCLKTHYRKPIEDFIEE